MNDEEPHGSPDFDRPTKALLNRLIGAATRRGQISLSVVNFHPVGRRNGQAEKGRLTLDINGTVQQYVFVTQGWIRSRAEVEALVKSRTAAFPLLLATAYLTPALADVCVEHDLQFIDLAGNLHVHTLGQYMLVSSRSADPDLRRLASKSKKPALSASTSALRMIFVLLSAPELLNRPYREIAAAAGVALGTVGSVLNDLRERGLMTGTSDRRLLDPAALRDEWTINYVLRLLPKLNVQRFSVDDPSWWQHAELPAGQAWWSGEVAAAKLAKRLRPVAQTIYIHPTARAGVTMALARRHRLRADSSGKLEIIDAFWSLDEAQAEKVTAPPLLVYADLQRTREPRNVEAAALILSLMEQSDESSTP